MARLFKNKSITFKLFFLVLAIIVLATASGVLLLGVVYRSQLRNEARTVAEHVVVFRRWVASFGTVWTRGQETDHLARQECADGSVFWSKNPALATRELSALAIQSKTRVEFRVTSDNYRNPANKPSEFEAAAIAMFQRGEAREYDRMTDDYYYYATPLLVEKPCLECHGDPASAPPEVIARYGAPAGEARSKGFGYQLGEVRGVIAVKVPGRGMWTVVFGLVGAVQMAFFVAALIFAFFFIRVVIVKPVRRLTDLSERISTGDVSASLGVGGISQVTDDEIQQLTLSMDRLRKGVQMIMAAQDDGELGGGDGDGDGDGGGDGDGDGGL